MKWLEVVFLSILVLGAAAPATAWSGALNDSEEPGSVLVFPKFVTGSVTTPDQGNLPRTQFEISVICPEGVDCSTSGLSGLGIDPGTITIRAHWVCPGDSSNFCSEVNFNLTTSVNGTISFNPENIGVGKVPGGTVFAPPPAFCNEGYLIAYVIDNANTANPIKFDGLIGDAVLRGTGTSARAYNAVPIQAAASLNTGDHTDVNMNRALDFDGTEYQAITGKVYGSVRSPENTGTTDFDTRLTLLTLDTISNATNTPIVVDLNFTRYDETLLLSTYAQFTCWGEFDLNDDLGVPGAASSGSRKLLVESTSVRPSATLIGLVDSREDFNLVTTAVGAGSVTIPGITATACGLLTLPSGCSCPKGGGIQCSVTAIAEGTVGLRREYTYPLFNDSTPVATTFVPD